ncbi:MAG: dTDP-4-dehydrorhamnose reductase [Marinomonas sp.]
MEILVLGKNGQLGWELQQTQNTQHNVIYLGSQELDITDEDKLNRLLPQWQPSLIINATAYTAVDKAESDQQAAYAVNSKGVEYLAKYCQSNQIKLIHISTDFVFDGEQNTPYKPTDPTSPVSVYGASKRDGERQVRKWLGSQASIVRTAWVYSQHGNNFVKTMLRLMNEKDQLGVVYDQVGTPTWAKGLAEMVWKLAEKMANNSNGKTNEEIKSEAPTPIYHWTDAGVTSWYDFAVAIQDIAFEKGLLDKKIPIRPIPASAYPTPAKRPSYSVLDKSAIEQELQIETKHWREQLTKLMEQLA